MNVATEQLHPPRLVPIPGSRSNPADASCSKRPMAGLRSDRRSRPGPAQHPHDFRPREAGVHNALAGARAAQILLDRLIDVFAEETNVALERFGSTTYKRECSNVGWSPTSAITTRTSTVFAVFGGSTSVATRPRIWPSRSTWPTAPWIAKRFTPGSASPNFGGSRGSNAGLLLIAGRQLRTGRRQPDFPERADRGAGRLFEDWLWGRTLDGPILPRLGSEPCATGRPHAPPAPIPPPIPPQLPRHEPAASACSPWRRCSRRRPARRRRAGRLNPLAPKPPHFAPKAKNCICIYLEGAPSQIDLFDPKPKLNELHGQKLPESFTKNVRFAFIQKETAPAHGQPAEVHEARPVRHGAVRLPAAPGDVRRRHLR